MHETTRNYCYKRAIGKHRSVSAVASKSLIQPLGHRLDIRDLHNMGAKINFTIQSQQHYKFTIFFFYLQGGSALQHPQAAGTATKNCASITPLKQSFLGIVVDWSDVQSYSD